MSKVVNESLVAKVGEVSNNNAKVLMNFMFI
jgi:hypothetical protein